MVRKDGIAIYGFQDRKSSLENFQNTMCKFPRLQSVLDVTINFFDGNTFKYYCFMEVFQETVGKKIQDTRMTLTRLIRCRAEVVEDLAKPSIQLPADARHDTSVMLLVIHTKHFTHTVKKLNHDQQSNLVMLQLQRTLS